MFSYTANQAKTQFGEMIAKAQREPVSITKNGKPSVAVMSVEDYNAIEVLKLRDPRAKLARSVAQAEAGKLHDGDRACDELIKDFRWPATVSFSDTSSPAPRVILSRRAGTSCRSLIMP